MKLTIELPDRVNANVDKRYALEALVATQLFSALEDAINDEV